MAGRKAASPVQKSEKQSMQMSVDERTQKLPDVTAGEPPAIGKHNVIHAVVMGGKRHASFKHK
jgi:hypothetical protein